MQISESSKENISISIWITYKTDDPLQEAGLIPGYKVGLILKIQSI